MFGLFVQRKLAHFSETKSVHAYTQQLMDNTAQLTCERLRK